MRRTLPSIVLGFVMALALVGSWSGPASAKPHPNHATVNDKPGDAPAGIDLLQAKYAVTKQTASFSVKVEQLTATTFIAFEMWPLAEGWDRIAIYRENGKLVHKLYFVDNEEGPVPHQNSCKALKASWNTSTDIVTASVPISCLQASRSGGADPFEFHTFSRFGGVPHSRSDAMPARTLDY
jgi:hypothetical protein